MPKEMKHIRLAPMPRPDYYINRYQAQRRAKIAWALILLGAVLAVGLVML